MSVVLSKEFEKECETFFKEMDLIEINPESAFDMRDNCLARMLAAKERPDLFINDPDWRVREEVAKLLPESMLNDEEYFVRAAAAEALLCKKS